MNGRRKGHKIKPGQRERTESGAGGQGRLKDMKTGQQDRIHGRDRGQDDIGWKDRIQGQDKRLRQKDRTDRQNGMTGQQNRTEGQNRKMKQMNMTYKVIWEF